MTIKIEKIGDSQDLPRETKETMPYNGGYTRQQETITRVEHGHGSGRGLSSAVGFLVTFAGMLIGFFIIANVAPVIDDALVEQQANNITTVQQAAPLITDLFSSIIPIMIVVAGVGVIIMGFHVVLRD